MLLGKVSKQPAEVKDYRIDYREWLSDVADTLDYALAAVTCLTDVDDTSLTVTQTQVAPTGVSVWLSGGTHGKKYKVEVTVETAGGRVDQSEFVVTVKEI